MLLTAYHRKTILRGLGLSQRQISRELGVDYSLVNHVVAGRRWMGQDARRVMAYLAENAFGMPLEQAFPDADRKRGWQREPRVA